VVFNITANDGIGEGTIVAIHLDYSAGNYSAEMAIHETVGLILEDFETGDFTRFNWQFNSNPWYIVGAAEAYEGDYAARSKDISDNQSSSMEIEYTVEEEGEISFYYKVSSESGYDYLRFYINGIMQHQWAGELDWTLATYDLEVGNYILKWEYSKDGSVSNGQDCAWVDYISFPANAAITTMVFLSPAEQNVNSDEIFNSTIEISNVENLGSFELEINFDPSLLQANSMALADFIGSTGRSVFPLIQNIDNTNGLIQYALTTLGSSLPGPDGSGELLSIQWQATDEISEDVSTPLLLQNVQITEPNGTVIPFSALNSIVNISACFPNDFDCDCDVDIVDVTMAAYAYGSSEGDPSYSSTYDMDNDGDVDIVDITMVTYNYGWTCGKDQLETIDFSDFRNDQVALSIKEGEANSENNILEAQLFIENIEQLGGFELGLEYDAKRIQIVEISSGDFLTNNQRNTMLIKNENDPVSGSILFAETSIGGRESGTFGAGQLLHIKYKSTDGNPADFKISDGQLARIDGQVIPFKLLSNQQKEVSQIQNIYPNPFKEYARIYYSLLEEGAVEFSIYNVFGEQVLSINQGAQEKGKHSYLLRNEALESGTYFVKMQQEKITLDVQRIVILQ